MPDVLDTNNPPANTPPSPNHKVICEFCGCALAPSGQVLRRGDDATKYMKLSDTVEAKDKEIARLNEELTQVKRERDELKSSSSNRSSGHKLGERVARTSS